MTSPLSSDSHTAFEDHRILAAGKLSDVALAVKRATVTRGHHTILVFQDSSGKQVDLDLSGNEAQIVARHAPAETAAPVHDDPQPEAAPRGRGRPKLGVVPREVTLLPRHWDWLAAQPGGASVALRKLVELARRENEAQDARRQRQEAAYRFMSSMAGNLPGFEEATRALYADDREAYARQIAQWPHDVRGYAMSLAWGAPAQAAAPGGA